MSFAPHTPRGAFAPLVDFNRRLILCAFKVRILLLSYGMPFSYPFKIVDFNHPTSAYKKALPVCAPFFLCVEEGKKAHNTRRVELALVCAFIFFSAHRKGKKLYEPFKIVDLYKKGKKRRIGRVREPFYPFGLYKSFIYKAQIRAI